MMQQAHIYISGTVQGVGFRWFVKEQAEKLGINGWVKNMSDGRVEAVLQGDKNKIEELIRLCRKGPWLAVVSSIAVNWEDNVEINGFRIC